jgi:hypothetical protein
MTKKFEAHFTSQKSISPSFVYVSPSDAYNGMFAVGILYISSSSGSWDSSTGIVKNFDFKQNLLKSEEEAILWAKNWLANTFNCSVTLNEVII